MLHLRLVLHYLRFSIACYLQDRCGYCCAYLYAERLLLGDIPGRPSLPFDRFTLFFATASTVHVGSGSGALSAVLQVAFFRVTSNCMVAVCTGWCSDCFVPSIHLALASSDVDLLQSALEDLKRRQGLIERHFMADS
ncbi:hypothetical protein BU25DRAFT_409744 [Macroventuria anomochaeta]|uniref:Uncharacterized protein n=1 Tax=Macroventuria anomochaeta TaxID=301207 RepID=A0ACB6S666_9PLEO|nr:uncharacterized protein BU25DRAFT_409744 [Macroventuria anomochaeta]KAF2628719.1 hypothetical protein BU25DRAFT_409744 [Macroventuria anomochaeta]